MILAALPCMGSGAQKDVKLLIPGSESYNSEICRRDSGVQPHKAREASTSIGFEVNIFVCWSDVSQVLTCLTQESFAA